jgi:hypothetical protein
MAKELWVKVFSEQPLPNHWRPAANGHYFVPPGMGEKIFYFIFVKYC